MLEIIAEAFNIFCTQQLDSKSTIVDENNQENSLVAYLDIESVASQKYRIFVSADKEFIQSIAKLFLEEEFSDSDTLEDMLLETINLVVGSAKVIAQDSEIPSFNISTPRFLHVGVIEEDYSEHINIQVNSANITIAIKQI